MPATAAPPLTPLPFAPSPGTAPFVRLWLTDISGAAEDDFDADVLGPDGHSRCAAFVRPVDRVRYLAAHTGLRELLGAELDLNTAVVRFTCLPCPCCGKPHGRPALAGPDTGIHFSLSHGGDLVLIALATSPVGVDVGPPPPPRNRHGDSPGSAPRAG
ncbi:4'-phosphopantetheinyl transferase family protein [Kitasatospora sp. NPDC015120]|uniref:4'-phosphopantetheinyl transferase family protein n=1 Tax=Kitasatospora sp. NPDC015120 TaxID=3364023 RepID=UPI0036F49434